MPSTGTLVVRVYTSRTQLPISNVTVTILQKSQENKLHLLAVRITDKNGKTEPVIIETPDRNDSLFPGESNASKLSIQKLQFMLRVIATENPAIKSFPTDGIYNEETMEAVMLFQKEHNMPVTGTVERNTWNAILDAYEEIQFATARPKGANIYPHKECSIYPNEFSAYLYPIQAMFCALSHLFDNIQITHVNGVNSGATTKNIIFLQRCANQTPDGIFTCSLWNILTSLHDAFVIRNPYYNGENT